jgi:hypothetical protein
LRLKPGILLIFFEKYFNMEKLFERSGIMSANPMDAANTSGFEISSASEEQRKVEVT